MNCNVLKNGGLLVFGCLFGVLFALLPTVAAAQGLEVTAPLSLTSRQEAVQYERYDYNLNRCAVVVVYLDDDNVDFQGDVRSTQYRGNGEWWVWMIQGASWLSITIPNYTPLNLEFKPLQSGKTYEVRISPSSSKLLLTAVEPFHVDKSRTDASKYSRLDSQGRTCALVRIGLVLPEAQFSGVEHGKYLNSEWMVWLSPGSTSFTISAQGYQSLTVQFEPVQAAVTYLMTVHKAGEMVVEKSQNSTQTEWVLQRRQVQPQSASQSNKRSPWWGISLGVGSYEVADDDRYFLINIISDLAFSLKSKSSFGPFVGAMQTNHYTIIQGGGLWKYTWKNNNAFILRMGFSPGVVFETRDDDPYGYVIDDDLIVVGMSYKFNSPIYISVTEYIKNEKLRAMTFGLGWSFGGKLKK
ncbi:MAG: hypothetical protein J6V98_00235 [Bacteroidales bacterium]|nr:hypothetical protein [Bacteroidales bacterium]